MNPHFEDAFKALKRSAEHMLVAHEAIQAAHGALSEGITAVLHAHDEHMDLRETVERLEATILQQGRDINALRDEIRALRNGHGSAPR